MLVVLFFFIIGIMRVMQRVSAKKASNLVNDNTTFFHYGGYYQLAAGLLSLISLFIVGFYGFNVETFLCALAAAILFALDLFSGIQAVKGTTLVVCNMFATGGLFIPCILGIFLFDEPMGVWQWFGLAAFIVAIYFLSAKKEKSEKSFSVKTLMMLLLSLLSNGLVMVVQKYFAILVPDGNVSLYSALTFGLNSLILYVGMGICILNKKKTSPSEVVKVEPLPNTLLICGALLAIALFVINILVTYMASTVPSVILFTVSSAISIMITCLVGMVVFKEKLTVKNAVGLVLGFISIVMVNV